MELIIKEKCTVTDIACLDTIVDHYRIENARPHITTYKSAVYEICVEFRDRVLDVTKVSTSFKYESITFVLGWQQTHDLTRNEIDGLLWKTFGDMANNVLFKYGLKRKLIKNDNSMFSNLKNFSNMYILSMMCTIQLYIIILHATLSSFSFISNGKRL